jgi:hypothetical protein
MKKLLFITVFAVTATAVNAQSFGIKAGANFSNATAKSEGESESGDMKIGFHVGASVDVPISGSLYLHPELQYSAEGWKEKDEDFDFEAKFNLTYINIPILLRYQTEGGFYGELGPQIGILAGAKVKVEDEDEDIKEFFNSTNLSLGIGAGYKLPMGIGFGARYNLGLSNIAKDGDSDNSVKTSTIQLSIFKTF